MKAVITKHRNTVDKPTMFFDVEKEKYFDIKDKKDFSKNNLEFKQEETKLENDAFLKSLILKAEKADESGDSTEPAPTISLDLSITELKGIAIIQEDAKKASALEAENNQLKSHLEQYKQAYQTSEVKRMNAVEMIEKVIK